jgi:hypothetical protein
LSLAPNKFQAEDNSKMSSLSTKTNSSRGISMKNNRKEKKGKKGEDGGG